MYVTGAEGEGVYVACMLRGMKEGVYVAGGVLWKEREERGSVCRGRSVAEGEGGKRACMSRARKEREERGRVCRGRSVTGEHVKEGVRGGERRGERRWRKGERRGERRKGELPSSASPLQVKSLSFLLLYILEALLLRWQMPSSSPLPPPPLSFSSLPPSPLPSSLPEGGERA